MKKIFLFALLILSLFSFFSCKKNNSVPGAGGSYHFTASIADTAGTFSFADGTELTNSGITFLAITGLVSPTTQESVVLTIDNSLASNPMISSNRPIVAGTYTDTSSNFTVGILYQKDTTHQYFGGTFLTQEAVLNGTPIVNHIKIVITSIDAISVKGTFSGDVYFNSDLGATKKTITSGDFYSKMLVTP